MYQYCAMQVNLSFAVSITARKIRVGFGNTFPCTTEDWRTDFSSSQHFDRQNPDNGPDLHWAYTSRVMGPVGTLNWIVNLLPYNCFAHIFFQIMIISIFSAILLLVSSSLLMNEVTHLANYPSPLGKIDLCKALRHVGKRTCGHLQIAAVRSVSCVLKIFSLSHELSLDELFINTEQPEQSQKKTSTYKAGNEQSPNVQISKASW